MTWPESQANNGWTGLKLPLLSVKYKLEELIPHCNWVTFIHSAV